MAITETPTFRFGGVPQHAHRDRRQPTSHRIAKGTSTPVLLFSSAVAGGVEAIVTYPFEHAKTLVQLHSVNGHRHNPFSVIYQVARDDGFCAVYTGCSTLVAGTAFKVSVRFASFSYYRAQLAGDLGSLTPMRGVLAGSLAGFTESIVAVTPTERLKTLLIEQGRTKIRSYRHGVCSRQANVGSHVRSIRGLYAGLVPTVLKQSSTQGVKMGSYNIIREAFRKYDVPQNAMSTFFTGASAGVVTVYVTQPFDTIKTWAQSTHGTGTITAFRDILRDAGFLGLWSGSTSRVGRLALSSSILYTVYERVTTGLNTSLEDELFAITQKVEFHVPLAQ